MGHKKDHDKLRARRHLDRLKWETAKELGLEKGVWPAGEALEPENLGVKDEKDAVQRGEEAIAEESRRKTELHLTDGF
ncbi:MAG: small acid-soluble spore protein [Bacillota bacterium]